MDLISGNLCGFFSNRYRDTLLTRSELRYRCLGRIDLKGQGLSTGVVTFAFDSHLVSARVLATG